MYCSSCGKKITENSKFCKYCGSSQIETERKGEKKINKKKNEYIWVCDFCGEEFEIEKESKLHELSCLKNPKNRKNFFKNNSQKSWFYLWITTLLVFIVSLYIFSKYSEKNVDFFASDYLVGLFFLNIIIGIIAFLVMFIVGFKKKNKPSFFTKKILIICLVYFLISPSIFAFEGNKAIKNEDYRKEHYVFITPTPIPTIEVKLTPTVTPKKTVKPIQKAVDTDPITDCVSSATECKGSSIKIRKSQCPNVTCCQIGSSWSLYPSSEKCKEAQNNAKPNNVNNSQVVPTTVTNGSPNSNKIAVFLSYNGLTRYCPPQNIDAIKSINSTMESKKSEWESKYNECVNNFSKTNSCWVSCNNTAFNGLMDCYGYSGSEYDSCRQKVYDNQTACLNKCPSAYTTCQQLYSEKNNLYSQIDNLCK